LEERRQPMISLFRRAFTVAVFGAALYAGHVRAAEGAGPAIGHVIATEVAEHEVKVEVPINPGGLETAYEIWLVQQQADPKGGPTNDGEPPTGGPQTQTGRIAAGFGYQTVSATLTDLQWGYTYNGVVVARNSACEKAKGEFEIALHISGEFPNGRGVGSQYESEIPCWYTKLSEEESAKTLREYEVRHAQELEARHDKEQQEQESREAIARREREETETGCMSLSGSTVIVEHGRTALVKLKCLGTAVCRGKLTLMATGAAARRLSMGTSKRRSHPRVIGAAFFSVEGDGEKTVDIVLNQAGRALVRSVRRIVDVNLELQELAPAGGSKQAVRVGLSKKRT
jgi:hypothetical protein